MIHVEFVVLPSTSCTSNVTWIIETGEAYGG